MRKKLSAIGNSLGIVIEKPILELLKIDRDTELEITTDGHRMIIAKATKDRCKQIDESARRVMKEHDQTLRNLAK
jgi:antitoxin MazE